jgi:HEPN domain-containing protein
MKDETRIWLNYSEENLDSAKILLESKLFNPCLQNIQQSVEKSLKALLIENSIKLKKTHSISELKNILSNNGLTIEISDEDCEFLDSIYLPSKYPLHNVLPYYEPDFKICNNSISIAQKVLNYINKILKR